MSALYLIEKFSSSWQVNAERQRKHFFSPSPAHRVAQVARQRGVVPFWRLHPLGAQHGAPVVLGPRPQRLKYQDLAQRTPTTDGKAELMAELPRHRPRWRSKARCQRHSPDEIQTYRRKPATSRARRVASRIRHARLTLPAKA
eukprot:scaffold30500_cov60-Phaeocystis_antarctica.AAC.7